MARAEARFDIKAEDKFSKNFTKAKKGLGGLNTSALGLAKSFGALAGVGGFGAMAHGAMELGSQLTHVSDRLKISVEAFGALSAAARDSGSSTEVMERALRNFKARVQAAAGGAGEMSRALNDLHLDADELLSGPLEVGFTTFATAVVNAKDQANAFITTQKLIGEEAGPQLRTVLEQLGTGWDDFAEKAAKAGRVMDGETARALESASTNIDILKEKLTILSGTVVGDLLGDADDEKGFYDRHVVPGVIGLASKAGALADTLFPYTLTGKKRESSEAAILAAGDWMMAATEPRQDAGNPFLREQKEKRERLAEGMDYYAKNAADKAARIEEENKRLLSNIEKVLDKIEGNTASGSVFLRR